MYLKLTQIQKVSTEKAETFLGFAIVVYEVLTKNTKKKKKLVLP